MTTGSRTPLRADARRNRDKIILAATDIFADDGPEMPMEKIAQLAGVGVGTLYRHFPDREALILAVVGDNMARMLAKARQATAEEDRAWDALMRTVGGSRELRLAMRLPSVFSPTTFAAIRADPDVRQIRRELTETINGLVRAAQEEGTLRPDVGSDDVIHLFTVLLRGLRATRDEGAEIAYGRARTVVLDGLRARPGTPLPGPPLTATDL